MNHQLEKDNSKFFKDEKRATDENIEALPIANENKLYTDAKIYQSDLPAFEVGDVFESGPRLIDLDVDGKERPIRGCNLP